MRPSRRVLTLSAAVLSVLSAMTVATSAPAAAQPATVPTASGPVVPAARPTWEARYDAGAGDLGGLIAVDPVTGTVVHAGVSTKVEDGNDFDISTVAYGPSGRELWSARVGGPDGYDQDSARAIVLDSARGVVYVAGAIVNPASPAGYSDGLLLAYDLAGRELWRVVTGTTSGSETWLDVALDPASGRVALTGSTRTIRGSSIDTDVLTQVVSPDAQVEWTRPYRAGARDDVGRAVAWAPDGGTVYVAGVIDEFVADGDGLTLAYVAASGAARWRNVIAGDPTSQYGGVDLADIGVSPDSRQVYVTGRANRGALTVAYGAGGREIWTRGVGGGIPTRPIEFQKLTVDPTSGYVYVAGPRSLRPADGQNYVVEARAYEPDGSSLWSTTVDQPPFGREYIVTDLALDPDSHRMYIGALRYTEVNFTQLLSVLVLGVSTRDGALRTVLTYDEQRTPTDAVDGLALDPVRNVLYARGYVSDGEQADFLTLAYPVP